MKTDKNETKEFKNSKKIKIQINNFFILSFIIELNNGLLYNLLMHKNHLISITKDSEDVDSYERIYQELANSGELDPDIFMEKIQEYN